MRWRHDSATRRGLAAVMGEQLNVLWAILGILILVVGPGGASYVANRSANKLLGEKLDGFITSVRDSLRDKQDWLKNLEKRTQETDAQVRELRAVLEDRDRRALAERERRRDDEVGYGA